MQLSSPNDFDWSPDNPDLVTERQPAIAVYENVGGSVTIRQEANLGEDEDPLVVITKARVPDLVRALLRVAGVDLPAQLLLLPPTSIPEQRRDAGLKDRDAAGNISASLFDG